MFEFIKIQYILGKITETQVSAFKNMGYITAEQEQEILANSPVK